MSKLTKEYDRLAKEAKKLKGNAYRIYPEGYIPKAKGTLTLINK